MGFILLSFGILVQLVIDMIVIDMLEKQINSSTIAYLLIYSASNITYLSGHGQRLIHYCCASR